MTNRILKHLDETFTEQLREHCNDLELATGGMVEFLVLGGEAAFIIRPDDFKIIPTDDIESSVAEGLREFGKCCFYAAKILDAKGGGFDL